MPWSPALAVWWPGNHLLSFIVAEKRVGSNPQYGKRSDTNKGFSACLLKLLCDTKSQLLWPESQHVLFFSIYNWPRRNTKNNSHVLWLKRYSSGSEHLSNCLKRYQKKKPSQTSKRCPNLICKLPFPVGLSFVNFNTIPCFLILYPYDRFLKSLLWASFCRSYLSF